MGTKCSGKKVIHSQDSEQLNCDVVLTPVSQIQAQRSLNPKFLSQLEQKYHQSIIDDYDQKYVQSEYKTITVSTKQMEKEIKLKIPIGILKAPNSPGAVQKHSVKFQLEETKIVPRTNKLVKRQPQFYNLGEKQNIIKFKLTNSFLTLSNQMSSQELE